MHGGGPVREIRRPGSVQGAARKGRPYRAEAAGPVAGPLRWDRLHQDAAGLALRIGCAGPAGPVQSLGGSPPTDALVSWAPLPRRNADRRARAARGGTGGGAASSGWGGWLAWTAGAPPSGGALRSR